MRSGYKLGPSLAPEIVLVLTIPTTGLGMGPSPDQSSWHGARGKEKEAWHDPRQHAVGTQLVVGEYMMCVYSTCECKCTKTCSHAVTHRHPHRFRPARTHTCPHTDTHTHVRGQTAQTNAFQHKQMCAQTHTKKENHPRSACGRE